MSTPVGYVPVICQCVGRFLVAAETQRSLVWRLESLRFILVRAKAKGAVVCAAHFQ